MKHKLRCFTDKHTIKIGLWRHGNGGYSSGITIYEGFPIFFKYFERHERNRLISFPSYYTKEEEGGGSMRFLKYLPEIKDVTIRTRNYYSTFIKGKKGKDILNVVKFGKHGKLETIFIKGSSKRSSGKIIYSNRVYINRTLNYSFYYYKGE